MSHIHPRAAAASLALTVAAFTALPLAGCGRQSSDVLARIDDETITVTQFNEVARGAIQQYPGPADSARTRLLDDLVQRELLVQGALRERLDTTPEFKAFRAGLERQMLREALFQRLVGGPFTVSDAEVKALYDRRGEATRTRVIFALTEDAAKGAVAALARGEDFATVANRYNPAGMVPPGGDIGAVQAGALLPPIDEMVRTGPLHKVLGPIEAGGEGFFVLRLDERRPVDQPPFDQERTQLAEVLRQRKQRMTVMRVVDNLRSLYQVRVTPGAAQAVVGQFRPADPSALVQAPQPPGEAERKHVLATFTGGQYTMGDAYEDLVTSGTNRPNLEATPAVERWIQAQTTERVALAEAVKRHLNEEPEVKQKMRDRLNNQLLEGYYQRAVIQRVEITAADYAAAYERYKDSFARLSRAKVQSVTLRDSATAATLAAQAGQAPSLREAAAAAATGSRVREETLQFPNASAEWAPFEGKLTSMRPGEVAGPYRMPSGWLLVQLIDKQQGAPPFEALPPNTIQQLQGVASEGKREARLLALTDSLRRVVKPFQVYPDRLRRIPWPPAPAPAPASPGT